MPIRSAAIALAATAALLTACGGSGAQFPPPAPAMALLQNAADLTRFDGRGQDITDMVLSARLIAVAGNVQPGVDSHHVAAKIHVSMALARGPALVGRSVTVPYLVTIAEGQNIIDQHAYRVTTTFPSNVDQMNVTDADIPMSFPVTPQKSAAAYTIFISFQLTPQQLAYNRAHAAEAARAP
jgi:hypothetical protein